MSRFISTQEAANEAIEVLLCYEGQVTPKRLTEVLNCSDKHASRLMRIFREKRSDILSYDSQKKCYFPTETFQLTLEQRSNDAYLNLILQQPKHQADTQVILAPHRVVLPHVLKNLCFATHRKYQVNVIYQSIKNPEANHWRVITPHTLVFSGIRWHVRAFCEKSQCFKDFVLSRFSEVQTGQVARVFSEQDHHWNAQERLVIVADPRLKPAQRALIEREYGMKNGQLCIETRGALIRYHMELLNIDTGNPNPASQQIIVEPDCWDHIQPYLGSLESK